MNNAQERKLYRGPKVLAGVCSGIAQHFNIDVIIVRIICALAVVFTGGIGAVAYLVLAFVIPECPHPENMVEVTPLSVQSDKYCNVVDCTPTSGKAADSRVGVKAGAGHIPPVPPQAFSDNKTPAAQAAQSLYAEQKVHVRCGESRPTDFFHNPAEHLVSFSSAESNDTSSIKLALILGLCLAAFFGVCAYASTLVLPGVRVLDLFPLLFVALGVVIIAVPSHRWCFSMRISGFLFCLELCVFLLPFTLGIVPLQAMTHIGFFAGACWVIVAGLIVVSLVSPSENIVLALVVVFMVAIGATFLDIGVVERTVSLITLGPPHKNSIAQMGLVYSLRTGVNL